jgi:hypothetical protein
MMLSIQILWGLLNSEIMVIFNYHLPMLINCLQIYIFLALFCVIDILYDSLSVSVWLILLYFEALSRMSLLFASANHFLHLAN